jgi:predicted 3-demethylubiquinone-9 3-methyltransferase (glyoxalase superfamily)
MQKITPFLWFDNNAEEAVKFYVSLFEDSKVISISKYPDSVPGMGGKVLNAMFELNGQQFMALDGGPNFKFTEAVSFYVNCENQEEVDNLWNKLITDGGEESRCGWLKDKYGLSWQIIPTALGKLMSDPDREKANRVMQCMLKMNKIIVKDLEKAAAGK